MKKSGFTMIELIFVIVIIGILAAVAIPKLAATRTDAKVATISQEIQSAVGEISAYATAQGGDLNDTNLTTMSQVLSQLVDQHKAKKDVNTSGIINEVEVYGDGNTTPVCVTLDANNTTLFVKTTGTGLICNGIKNIIHDANYTVAGSRVNF